MSELTVTRNDEKERYELRDENDDLAGVVVYTERGGRTRFMSTEIDPAFRGRGYGSVLAEGVVADAVRRGDTIEPLCPFIADYLREHPVDGADIVWPKEGTP